MDALAERSGHLTPSTLRTELQKLEHKDTPVFVYGLKPAFEEEIRLELAPFQDKGLKLLAADEILEF